MLRRTRSSPGVAFTESFSSSDRRCGMKSMLAIASEVPHYFHSSLLTHPHSFLPPSSFGRFAKRLGANPAPQPFPSTPRVFAATFPSIACTVTLHLSTLCIHETNCGMKETGTAHFTLQLNFSFQILAHAHTHTRRADARGF